MTRHYCSYFDHRYLPRGLAMIRSLHRFESESLVWVLCLNDECHTIMTLLAEPNVRLIRMEEFESENPALAPAKQDRSLIEYYFTCTPSLVCFVMDHCSAGDTVTYVDGDLYFFSDPQPLYDELGQGVVSICPHRFAPWLKDRECYGLYNVGWLTFRNDTRGKSVVQWWRDRCNEWCFDVLEKDRFADQKYLDCFPKLFEGVVVLQHDGANVAPWNIGRYRMDKRDATILVDGKVPLIFFHFHGLKRLGRFAYRAAHRPYRAPFRGVVRREIYLPYIAELAAIARQTDRYGTGPAQLLVRHAIIGESMPRRLKSRVRHMVDVAAAMARAEVVYVVAKRVI